MNAAHRPATQPDVEAEPSIEWPVTSYTGQPVAVCAVCWFRWPCRAALEANTGGES